MANKKKRSEMLKHQTPGAVELAQGWITPANLERWALYQQEASRKAEADAWRTVDEYYQDEPAGYPG